MKAFKQYLMESHRTYDFRIRMACEATTEVIDKIKVVLEKYQLDTMSKPKRLPIQESPEFPNMGPVEINIIDISLNYPVNEEQVRTKIAESGCVQLACIKVNPLNSPYEAALERKEQSNKDGIVVMTQEEMQCEPPAKDLVGNDRVPTLIKELEETRKYQYPDTAGGKTKAKGTVSQGTTNEIPVGQVSPIGTHQNKIPVAKKMPAGNGR